MTNKLILKLYGGGKVGVGEKLTHTSDIPTANSETFSSIRDKFSVGNTTSRRKKISENLNQSLIMSTPTKRKLLREEKVQNLIGIVDGANPTIQLE